MTILLDGTSGITSPGGDTATVSVATPIVKSPSSLTLQTNGSTTALTIDTGGKVGIGTSSPTNIVDISVSYDAILNVKSTGTIQSSVLTLIGRQSSVDNSWSIISTGNGLAGPQLRISQTSWTSGTPELVINANAAVILKGGNAAANGVGITFPATQSASTDANTLDDYEEGTFTPSYVGTGSNPTVTYVTNDTWGKYTKIGNIVYFNLEIRTSAYTGGSGDLQIVGLPFTSAGFKGYSNMIPAFYNIVFNNAYIWSAEIQAGTSVLLFRGGVSGGASAGLLVSAVSNANPSLIRISGSYPVS